MSDIAVPVGHYHDLHCSADRIQPMGCVGCTCLMYQRARKAEKSDEYRYRVTHVVRDPRMADRGRYYVSKFTEREFAMVFVEFLAMKYKGDTIYLEDYHDETSEEIVCEVKRTGKFHLPLDMRILPQMR